MSALICPNCGGPLPAEVAERPFVTCAYCCTTSNAHGQMLERHQSPPQERDAPPDDEWERRIWEQERAEQQREQAWKAFQDEVLALGTVTFAGLRDATRKHLAALGQNDALARVCFAMAQDFEREHDVDLSADPIVFWRLADGYMKAVRELVKADAHVVKLPFFTATSSGPLHYERTLTVEVMRELAAREPTAKKKGLFAKLFG